MLSFAASGAGLVKGGRLVFLFPEHHSGSGASASSAGGARGAADADGGDGGDNVCGDEGASFSGGGSDGGGARNVRGRGGGGGVGGDTVAGTEEEKKKKKKKEEEEEETLSATIRRLSAGRPGVARVAPFLPKHRDLRLVSVCAQEFKGMSRHAVVMERV